jgi:hypothetical protein
LSVSTHWNEQDLRGFAKKEWIGRWIMGFIAGLDLIRHLS